MTAADKATPREGTEIQASQNEASQNEAPAAPLFTVIKGSPSDAELAALTAVLIARAAASASAPVAQGPRDLWGNPEDLMRSTLGVSATSFLNSRFG